MEQMCGGYRRRAKFEILKLEIDIPGTGGDTQIRKPRTDNVA
jgi:hypothetical protein